MKAQELVKSRLIYFISQRSVSVNELAKRSNLSFSTLNSILNGHSKKSEIETISKICSGLGISLHEFFDDEMFKTKEK